MDSMVDIYLERADNEVYAAESLRILSENEESKENFEIPNNTRSIAQLYHIHIILYFTRQRQFC